MKNFDVLLRKCFFTICFLFVPFSILGEEESELDAALKSLEEKGEESENNVELLGELNYGRLPHKFKGGVNDIKLEYNLKNSFYVAGEDGFVSKIRYPSMQVETWQLSTLAIKKIAPHPDGTTIAIYETNGAGLHKISTWNWRGHKRLFIIRPNYLVTSLSWSANGSYLFVGNIEKGIEVFDKNGNVVTIYSTPPSIILLATTGKREKSVVTYGKNGKLLYTGISNRKKLAEYKCEEELENPRIIKNFTRLAGYKDGKVYLINATSGKEIAKYDSHVAIFAIDAYDDDLIWLEKLEKKQKYALREGEREPIYFSFEHSITSSIYLDSSIIVGTEDGDIYTLKKENNNIAYNCPFTYHSENIKDIVATNGKLYLIADDEIFCKENSIGASKKLKGKTTSNSILATDKYLILWNKEEKKPVYRYDLEKQKKATLYKPSTSIIYISIHNGNLLVVEASGLISLIDIQKKKVIFNKTIEGAQAALTRGMSHIIVAKDSLDNTASPLFELNLETEETVPIKLKGELAFSLARNSELEDTFFCFLLDSSEKPTTNLIKFSPQDNKALSGTFENLLTYEDEDFSGFIESYKESLITNLGKGELICFNIYSKRLSRLQRDYALPKKAVILEDYIVSLSYDSTISWYNLKTLQPVK